MFKSKLKPGEWPIYFSLSSEMKVVGRIYPATAGERGVVFEGETTEEVTMKARKWARERERMEKFVGEERLALEEEP